MRKAEREKHIEYMKEWVKGFEQGSQYDTANTRTNKAIIQQAKYYIAYQEKCLKEVL